MVLIDAPAQGGPKVFRVQGSKVYHTTLECSRIRTKPDRRGQVTKPPNAFPEGEAKALGWTPCRSCSGS